MTTVSWVTEFSADLLIKVTVVLVAALVIVRFMRRASAASRHVVWMATLVAVLLLPIIQSMVPALPVPLLRAAPTAATITASGLDAAAQGPAALPGDTAEAVTIVPSAPPEFWRWSTVLTIVWAAGIAVLVVRGAFGWTTVRRLARATSPATDPRIVTFAQSLSSHLRIRRPVTVLLSADDVIPMTWGVIAPTILLPSSAIRWADDRLRAVLLHELAHISRVDALWHAVARGVAAAFWCHPLVWLAVRYGRLERERACDDVVLRYGMAASGYADDLLALAHTMRARRRARPALAMTRRSDLHGRLLAILALDVSRLARSRVSLVIATVLIAGASVLSPVRLAAVVPDPVRVAVATPQASAELPAPMPTQTPVAAEAPVRAVVRRRPHSVAPAQSPPTVFPSFAGAWVPKDPTKHHRFFAVGLTEIPGDGTMSIAQDSSKLTVTWKRPDWTAGLPVSPGDLTFHVTYDLKSGGAEKGGVKPVNRARWEGNQLIIDSDMGRNGYTTAETSFLLIADELQIENRFHRESGHTNVVTLMYRKAGSR